MPIAITSPECIRPSRNVSLDAGERVSPTLITVCNGILGAILGAEAGLLPRPPQPTNAKSANMPNSVRISCSFWDFTKRSDPQKSLHKSCSRIRRLDQSATTLDDHTLGLESLGALIQNAVDERTATG